MNGRYQSVLAEPQADPASDLPMDGRRPMPLDRIDHALRVTAGQVDIFAVDLEADGATGRRHHLFRVDRGEIIVGLHDDADPLGGPVKLIAIGTPGAQARLVSQTENISHDDIAVWLRRLAGAVTDTDPRRQLPELTEGAGLTLAAGQCVCGPARGVIWLVLAAGSARLMGHAAVAEGIPLPLNSGMWIAADPSGCTIDVETAFPPAAVLRIALARFHRNMIAVVTTHLALDRRREAQRLAARGELTMRETLDAFDRLSGIIGRRFDSAEIGSSHGDRLLDACRIVGNELGASATAFSRAGSAREDFEGVLEIAQNAHLRVRQVLLRGDWWRHEAGPLVGWLGEQRNPVALLWQRRGYAMIDTRTGVRRRIDRAIAMQFAPEAAAFYPSLPSGPLRFWQILQFAVRHSGGNAMRIALAVGVIGLLSLVTPLITNILINSVIPRSEIDQIAFCAVALGLTAASMAGIQAMEGLAMLRLEAAIDWKLQAAIIDRLLKLPAAVFREYTAGEFVDRAMGIDGARRALTGRALRGMLSGLFCWFSIGLMLYYDAHLALIAIALTIVRAVAIIATSMIRLYFETEHFNAQGKISGFVLQLLVGVAKLRVAAATARALAVWSGRLAAQKRHFIASQMVGNAFGVFETAFPTLSTLIIFAYASYANSGLLTDVGGFMAFFSAFGQSMGAMGSWAAGVSEALIAIPPLMRMRPLLSTAAEVADERKSPGDLSGTVELTRVTFRYLPKGPPVLDDVTIKVAQGEYVAIVGPSGSGKSSLFRLLLGFEHAESGAVFYDGKSLETLDIGAVRRQIGVVLQNDRLATGSIYENICGGVRLPLERAWDAARLAGLTEDIEAMPMGLLTNISEGVSTLSGGQRQRVMIARAIARRPRILLFDEATSALDNQSQAIVSDALDRLNVTRIVIAHRLSTVRRADRIVVLANGKVEQAGTFDELSSTPGLFATFAQRQLL